MIVQKLLSLQARPLGRFVCLQTPVELQASVVHTLASSEHGVPDVFGVAEHAPSAGLQVGSSKHSPKEVHTIGFAPVQVPA